MSKHVFKGTINGTSYDNYEEFVKAFKNFKPSEIKSYNYSFSSESDKTDGIDTAFKETCEQKTYDNVYDLLNVLLGPFVNQLTNKKVETNGVLKTDEETNALKLPYLDLDSFNGDEEHDGYIIDRISEQLYNLKEQIKKLDVEKAKQVIKKFDNAFEALATKHEATAKRMDELVYEHDELDDKIEQLENEIDNLENKISKLDTDYDILSSADDALALYEDFRDELEELFEQ